MSFNPQIPQLLVQLFSNTLLCFRDTSTLFSQESLRNLLHSCPFVETTLNERYNILQQIKLVKLAFKKLATFQQNIDSELIGGLQLNKDNDDDDEDIEDNEAIILETIQLI